MRKIDDKGNIAIIMCLVFTGLLALSAYVLDIGIVYSEKAKLSNAVDAAVLAAVFELPKSDTRAINVANDYLIKNNVETKDAVITIGSDHKSMEIKGIRTVNHILAPIFGKNSSNIKSNTKAIIGPVKSLSNGIRPFAVEKFPFSYGDLITLKQGAGDGYHGNYGPVALGGTGASVFKDNALYGYKGKISVGDYIDTETGNMEGATSTIAKYVKSESSTFTTFKRDSIRIWVIPLVDSLIVNGRNQVQVVGFGEFYVEDVVSKAGKTEINGRFIKFVTNGEIDLTLQDTGLYGVKLSR
jgi:hypothetical protein